MKKRTMILAGIAFALMTGNVAAKEYFKWVDENGVTRYAETPPAGVHAEKVNTYAGSSSTYDPSAENAETAEAKAEAKHKEELEAQARKLEEDEKQRCQKVSDQYKTLKERGRVRMRDKDGNERVLSPEEHAAKLAELEKYLADMCSGDKKK